MAASAVPPGHSVRAPEPGDAGTVFDVFATYNTAIVGFADLTAGDIDDNFAEPGFSLATDAWLAHDDDGRPSGYGCVFGGTGSPEHHIEVAAADPALARWLLGQAIARSQQIARDADYAEVTIDIGIYRNDDALRAFAAEAGFEPGTTYHRMRIDHSEPADAPELPAGVVRRTGGDDPGVRRAGHGVIEAAFAGQFGMAPQAFDEWHEVREARSSFTWSQLVVLEVDGEPVAAREDNDQFVEDEGCGYIARLAVVDHARGRGLAKLLLRDGFATHAAAGRVGTILHVDTNNPTPALDLYTSVGMKAVLVIDVWRAVVPT